jgi:hypothetical protein
VTGCAACETVIKRTSCKQMHLSKIFRRLMKKVTECGRLSDRPKSSERNGNQTPNFLSSSPIKMNSSSSAFKPP